MGIALSESGLIRLSGRIAHWDFYSTYEMKFGLTMMYANTWSM